MCLILKLISRMEEVLNEKKCIHDYFYNAEYLFKPAADSGVS